MHACVPVWLLELSCIHICIGDADFDGEVLMFHPTTNVLYALLVYEKIGAVRLRALSPDIERS